MVMERIFSPFDLVSVKYCLPFVNPKILILND
ncbi:hypothetical protein RIR_e16952_A0A2I1EAY1_9GLOM [Rhizophagus irregularis DAOM 181602=DAOM 197198]|nr:hypothetical protein RIR_e16952_A0A2I1EAY1_9GLOM [Rhizophagus irregularis DAOM 181602=DAOM 197198]